MIKIIEIALIIYYIQLFGIILNESYNLLMIIIAIELLILSLILIFLNLSYIFDDFLGNLFTIILLPICGGEAALG